jgi:multidrug efflux pump subunit AcrB
MDRRGRDRHRRRRIPGLKVYLYTSGIRGIRFNRGDDDVGLRIKGPDLDTLARLADRVVARLKSVEGLRNVQHSNEDVTQELKVRLDRRRAASYGLDVEDVGSVLRYALEGQTVTEYIDGDRGIDVRCAWTATISARPAIWNPFCCSARPSRARPSDSATWPRCNCCRSPPRSCATVSSAWSRSPPRSAAIRRWSRPSRPRWPPRRRIELPPGYVLYEAGSLETLQQGRDLGRMLLALALFLVLVVMAVQYESLRNPLIILISVPFTLIGVVLGLQWSATPLSMPVWLGLIMLAGIVVNNAIVLVEFIELRRRAGDGKPVAIVEAARLRLRPILMTTLTTVVGMLPLALAVGEGSEMLQPLALVIVWGLSFSTLVSLLLVPMIYRLLGAWKIGSTATGRRSCSTLRAA